MALAKLINEKYTMKNACNQQKPAKYVQIMAYYAKGANINAIYNQLTFGYKNIVAKLQVFINSPIADFIMLSFIQSFKIKKVA